MTIGHRIKEERDKLKFSQEAFAALAKASKRAQIDWEKGVSSPTAMALAAFASAGADVLYILTGRREGVAGSGLSIRDAESQMDQVEAALYAAGDALPSTDAAHRSLLQSIALDETLPDRIRARADTMLQIGFADNAADQRSNARQTRVFAKYHRVRKFVDDAARAAGYAPSPQVKAGLERLITTAPDAPDDVIKWVIADLIAAIQAEGKT